MYFQFICKHGQHFGAGQLSHIHRHITADHESTSLQQLTIKPDAGLSESEAKTR